ncbi:MAG: glycerophosphoryl diester phosphodiesterase membrane domain-containing protein [Spirochaetia bacterium]|jgi:glycerophosphoryl diester phosphodiesterase|nr:glycerophosphoryl diester phosphodiesterase membrane domain-containing protein [Spirochaetia bacterium]
MYKLIKDNLIILVVFEAIYTAFISFIFSPLLRLGINTVIRLAGYPFLDQSNVLHFLCNPLVIIAWLFFFFAISLVTLFDYNAINLIYLAGVQQKGEISILGLLQKTFDVTDKMPRWHNIGLYIYICLLLPFSGIVYQNPVIENLKIPSFIMEYIKANPLLMSGLIVGIVAALRYSFLNLFSFLYLLVSKNPRFAVAEAKSNTLVHHTAKEIVPALLKCTAITFLLLTGLLGTQTAFYHISLHLGQGLPFRLICSALLTANLVITVAVNVIVKVYIMYVIASIFFAHEPVPEVQFLCGPRRLSHKGRVIRNCILGAILFVFVLSTSFVSVNLRTKIMAHRGAGITEIENTKPAFLRAMADGVAYIELDVVETKDHKLVICHDHNLKRLAGLDKNIENMDLDQVLAVPIHVGDKSGHLMTLEELLPLVKPTVVLNIELKTSGTNAEAMAEEVTALLKKYPRHLISSLDANALRYVKQLNSMRKTGLIMVVAAGKFQDFPYADFFSIEKSFATTSAIKQVHEINKQIFVWNVDDMEDARKFFKLNVDGIITDYPKEMEQELYRQTIDRNTSHLKLLFVSEFPPSLFKL